jgi:hypothetical protein
MNHDRMKGGRRSTNQHRSTTAQNHKEGPMSEGRSQDIKDLSQVDRRKAKQAQLDYAAWRDHLAAPGSRFERDRRTPPPAVRFDTVARRTDAAVPDRRAA